VRPRTADFDPVTSDHLYCATNSCGILLWTVAPCARRLWSTFAVQRVASQSQGTTSAVLPTLQAYVLKVVTVLTPPGLRSSARADHLQGWAVF
jgi:hypothetical protein